MGAVSVSGSLPLDPGRAYEIRNYLNRLLAARPFVSSRRRCQLLRYLVERNLDGAAGEISEYAIGIDVFERPPSFDPRNEATVRVEVSRLRKVLLEYYEKTGAADAWRIRISARGYAAIIEPAAEPAAEPAVPEIKTQIVEPAAGPIVRNVRKRWVAAGAIAMLAIAGTPIARHSGPGPDTVRSVVVLPFENLTGNPANEYLADGVTEQLHDSLAAIPSLRVIARASSYKFKGAAVDIREIGRRLNADAVVRGSLRAPGGKLRLIVQANRTADGFQFLSKTFDGNPKDIGRLEVEAIPAVLAVVRPGAPREKPRVPDPEAHDLLLKAWALRGKGTEASAQQCIIYIKQAIEKDPSYADAYAALASAYAADAANFSSDPLEYAKLAHESAAMALRLDPASALAYSAEGFVDSMVLLDWKSGEREMRYSIRLMPQSAVNHNRLGLILLAQARYDEALTELQTAEDLDPLSGGAGVTVGLGYYMARRYDDALRAFALVERTNPDLIAVHPFIGAAWQQKGELNQAEKEYRLAMTEIPGAVKPQMAILMAARGKRAEATKILDELEHPKPSEPPPNAFDVAAIYAALGQRDRAFYWLDLAYQRRIVWLLKIDPALDSLRQDVRFQELLVKAGLG
jgi:TolB-like protein/Tfp pilus assembly protein PilF